MGELREHFERLQTAVLAKDPGAVQSALEAIDAAVQGADPLTRAATYAEVQLLRGRPLEAARVLEDVLAVIGDDARVHHQVGVYREQGGDEEGALRSYERAGVADPMWTEAWVCRGALLDRRGDPGAALLCYRSAMLSNPQHVGTWRNMGNALAAQRKFDEAAGAYDTALALAAGDQTIAFLRASAHAAKGDLQTADRLLTDALRAEFGRPCEERDGNAVCRFFTLVHQEVPRRAKAKALLAAVDSLPEPMRVAEHNGVRYICDPDPVTPGKPHRFFDASTAVSKA